MRRNKSEITYFLIRRKRRKLSFRFIKRAILPTLLMVIVVGYAWFRSEPIRSGPQITVTEPEMIEDFLVRLDGNITRAQSITINQKPVVISAEGNFSEVLGVWPGINLFDLRVSDRLGKENRKLITYVHAGEALEPNTDKLVAGQIESVQTLEDYVAQRRRREEVVLEDEEFATEDSEISTDQVLTE